MNRGQWLDAVKDSILFFFILNFCFNFNWSYFVNMLEHEKQHREQQHRKNGAAEFKNN